MLFIAPGTPMQLIVGSVAAVLMMVAYSTLDPYVDDADDSLQTFSQFTIFLNYFMAVLITMNQTLADKEDEGRIDESAQRTQSIVTGLIVGCSIFPVMGLIYFTFQIICMPYIQLYWRYWLGKRKTSLLDEQETELARVLTTNHVKTHQTKLRIYISKAMHLPNAEDIVGSAAHHPEGANGTGLYFCCVEWDGVEYDATRKQAPSSKNKDADALHDQNTATVRVRVMVAAGLVVPEHLGGHQPFVRGSMIGNFDDPTGEKGVKQHKRTKTAQLTEGEVGFGSSSRDAQQDWSWHEDLYFEVADIDSAKLQLELMTATHDVGSPGLLGRHLSKGSMVRSNSQKNVYGNKKKMLTQRGKSQSRASPPHSVRSIKRQGSHREGGMRQHGSSGSLFSSVGAMAHAGNKFAQAEIDFSDALENPEPQWFGLLDSDGAPLKSSNGKQNARVSLIFQIATKMDTETINRNFHSTSINWQKKLEYFLPPQSDDHKTTLSFKI
jgi:hypothetical protein